MSVHVTSSDFVEPGDEAIDPPGEQVAKERHGRRRIILATFVAGAIVAAFAVWQLRPDTNSAIESSTAITAEELEGQYGVRLDVVGLLASGGLIELKFQVTDADKATALFGEVEDMPVLAVEESTVVLESAKGMKHQLTLLDGASYFFLYTNVGNAVHEGSQVAFVVNGIRIPHLIVQQ